MKDHKRIISDDYELTDRIKRLREDFFAIKPSICVERARYITESYKETEGQPYVLRRAKALDHILTHISTNVWDDELIVGNLASQKRAAPVFPEFSVQWIKEELEGNPFRFDERPGDQYQFTEEVKRELIEEIIPYWFGKTHQDRVNLLAPKDTWEAIQEVKACDDSWLTISGDGHTIPDYQKILHMGIKGVIEQAKKKIESLDFTDPDNIEKVNFLQSVIITNEAAVKFAARYADEAARLAKETKDEKRKQELLEIERICRKVPYEPADSFQEAIQTILFVNVVTQIENNGHSISFGRVDQYLYPYFMKDLESQKMSMDEGFELINCLWLKLNEDSKLRDWHNTRFFVGNPLFQNLTIGGQTIHGKDAVNELSYLCLASTKHLEMIQPSLTVRYFNGISLDFLYECAKVIRKGLGMPAMFNDEAIIPSMLSIGYQYEDAKDYGITGCVEPSPQGKIGGRFGAGFPNFPKMLEIAYNNGTDPKTGLQPLKGRGYLDDFQTFDALMAAFKEQLDFYLKHHTILENVIDKSWEDIIPNPFLSSLIDDCIERGKEIKQGGAKYDFTGGQETGIVAAANSLAAIKKVVFEDQLITTQQLRHALETNFEDQLTTPSGDVIRQLLLNKGPKFGNDDEQADSIVAELIEYWAKQKMQYRNTRYGKGPIGGVFIPSTATVAANVPSGSIVGATPDGRKAFEPVSEGISALRGTDRNGPTALINSVGSIPNELMPGGQLLNVKLNPSTVAGDKGLDNLVSLIQTLFHKKGFHVQFNIITEEELRDAQEKPQDYKDLVVRVAGYSSYFIELDREIQNEIIDRTEHEFQ